MELRQLAPIEWKVPLNDRETLPVPLQTDISCHGVVLIK